MKSVCVIILNWNGHQDTLECVHSLISAKPGPDTIVVCDNASTDHSLDIIQEQLEKSYGYRFAPVSGPILKAKNLQPSVVLLPNESNRGFAAGNNPGIRYALQQGFEYVWLLNNDTVILEDALEQLLKCARSSPETGIWGSTIVYHDDPDKVQCAGGCSYNPATTVFSPALEGYSPAMCQNCPEPRMDYIYGASFFVRKDVFHKTGLLDERYFLFYEELDFCIRARQRSFKTGWCRASIIRHKQGQSVFRTVRTGQPKIIAYHENLSTLIFTATHYPLLVSLVLPVRFLGKLTVTFRRREFGLISPLLQAYGDFFRMLIRGHFKKSESRGYSKINEN